MTLRIGEKMEQVGGDVPHADWAVRPTTPWNYGLRLPENDTALNDFPVKETPISPVPFAVEYPPVVVSVPAYRLPEWELANDSAATLSPTEFAPPLSPEREVSPIETVELVPYGSTLLRISEFPHSP